MDAFEEQELEEMAATPEMEDKYGSIKEACIEGQHDHDNYQWAYVECDCPHCEEARKEIVRRAS